MESNAKYDDYSQTKHLTRILNLSPSRPLTSALLTDGGVDITPPKLCEPLNSAEACQPQPTSSPPPQTASPAPSGSTFHVIGYRKVSAPESRPPIGEGHQTPSPDSCPTCRWFDAEVCAKPRRRKKPAVAFFMPEAMLVAEMIKAGSPEAVDVAFGLIS